MVDRTIYSDKDHTPEQAVRNIFGRQRAPTKLCLLFAEFSLLTFDRIAQLGEDPIYGQENVLPNCRWRCQIGRDRYGAGMQLAHSSRGLAILQGVGHSNGVSPRQYP